MKKIRSRNLTSDSAAMRKEYDFTGAARGKHHNALRAGYTITVHHEDGSTSVKEIAPRHGAVQIEPDLVAYFPDSESVNRALRCLVPLLPRKRTVKTKKT